MTDFVSLVPLVFVALPIFVLLLVDTRSEQLLRAISVTGFLLAAIAMIMLLPELRVGARIGSGLLAFDPFVGFTWTLFALFGLLVAVATCGTLAEDGVRSPREWFMLLHASVFGAGLAAASVHAVSFIVGFETMSLSVACMVASGVTQRASAEGALKYFFASSVGTAILLLGLALLFGLTGSLAFDDFSVLLRPSDQGSLATALMCVLVGVAFKLGLVPFHVWSPDAYQGAPRGTTLLMATLVKLAAAFSVGVVLIRGLAASASLWIGPVWYLVILSIVVGNVMALRQSSTKRLVAYSGISHAGFLAMMLLSPELVGVGAALFYAVLYGFASLGFFAAVFPFFKEAMP